MTWTPDPQDLIIKYDGGTGDMGSLTPGQDDDVNTSARFCVEDSKFILDWLRVHFSGSGTGQADMAIYLDSRESLKHDTKLWTVPAVGIAAAAGDNDVFFRVGPDELCHWTFQKDDVIVLVWTNPDNGNIFWGAEAGLVEVSTDA